MESRRSLQKRIAGYPGEVAKVGKLYSQVTAAAEKMGVDTRGELRRETDHFQAQLRTYDLALGTCLARCESLMAEMQSAATATQAYIDGGLANEDLLVSSTLLAQVQAALLLTLKPCKAHRETVKKARQALKVMKKQQDLAQLAVLIGQLQSQK